MKPSATATISTRRSVFQTAGAVAAAAMALPRVGVAAESAAEKANIQIVNEFCVSWQKHDLEKIMSFFADNGAYRVTEAQEPIKGKPAVQERVKSFLDRVNKFEVLDTWAKGPMVFNERIDYFTGGPLKSWHGVGVFFLKDGKIVEWYDYTIAVDRG
jgi:limonene-1,2-epoxide hydrolase